MLHFEWDPVKNLRNSVKHGVSFDDAKTVFFDPCVLIQKDRVENGEIRWLGIGRSHSKRLLIVSHVVRETAYREFIRIISARRALPHEISQYQERAY